VPPEVRAALLLEAGVPADFVTRFQQTSGAVMAKGMEDTAFYRYSRLLALNEVGGNPGRFSLPVAELHAANRERDERFPRHLLAGTTHDTKRSADVRARLAALSWVPEDWEQLVHSLGVRGEDDYLALQTVVGAWPIAPGRVDAYLEKALREGKRTSSWLDPDEQAERRVQQRAHDFLESAEVERFVEFVRPLGERISLGMTLLRATAPGVPDVYQGDELELLALVDPDNRRPVDWDARRSALADPPPKLRVLREALALRGRRPGAFTHGYEPLEPADGVIAYRRGPVLVAVPVRADAAFEPPAAARNLLDGVPVWLSEG
jgi:(1->4)-alpha-D-glucan 1-alpha-D-glucosylmutase